ncbi:hypothetical protein [Pseudoalteromonas viridis]|uniref:Uncharacterized protein n=1 Tax=Pseudoalteromonas viridis TaxID=339617 RepID=A0ABX7V0V8_9GAMM|nr:hypothetical protein [Pseudoalteromonas viridis]QTL34493.1 hypothetical protein J5X90_13185 [Pseudoalteromonas viridis]
MGKANPVTIAGIHFNKQGDAVSFFNDQKKDLLPEGMIEEGELFSALKDVYERYCNNSPGYELNGRLITGFSVDYERRNVGGTWVTHPCYKAHFSNDEIRPFSIAKAVKSVADNPH